MAIDRVCGGRDGFFRLTLTAASIENIDIAAVAAAYGRHPIGPIAARLLAAAQAWEDAETEEATQAAAADYAAAEAELMESDEMIPWECREEGYAWRTVLAATAEDALAAIHDEIGSYDTSDGTIWIDHCVSSLLLDETACETIEIEPREPDCAEGHDHDWRSPYSVVGGIEENPGVHAHGGGVIITEVCAHCGAYRVTDTWAQRPDTGEQGLTEVEYRDADDVSLTYVLRPAAACRA